MSYVAPLFGGRPALPTGGDWTDTLKRWRATDHPFPLPPAWQQKPKTRQTIRFVDLEMRPRRFVGTVPEIANLLRENGYTLSTEWKQHLSAEAECWCGARKFREWTCSCGVCPGCSRYDSLLEEGEYAGLCVHCRAEKQRGWGTANEEKHLRVPGESWAIMGDATAETTYSHQPPRPK